MDNTLIAPDGVKLVLNMASEQEREELYEIRHSLPHVDVGSRELADLEGLAFYNQQLPFVWFQM